jgi:hypothetical protein
MDCGADLERVLWPSWHGEMGMDWWQARIANEACSGFPLEPPSLPCGRERHTLQDFKRESPPGFARFSIEAMSPGIPDPKGANVTSFENILGCRVRRKLQPV